MSPPSTQNTGRPSTAPTPSSSSSSRPTPTTSTNPRPAPATPPIPLPRTSSLSPPPYPGPPPRSSSLSPSSTPISGPSTPTLTYPPDLSSTLVTTTTTSTTTTTTTITTTQTQTQTQTQVQERHLFAGLALPGLGLLRRKSTSRPGSAQGREGSPGASKGDGLALGVGGGGSPASPAGLSPVSQSRAPGPSPTGGQRSVSAPLLSSSSTALGPAITRATDLALLLSKPLPSPPANTTPPSSDPSTPLPSSSATAEGQPSTPAVTLTPSSPPGGEASESSTPTLPSITGSGPLPPLPREDDAPRPEPALQGLGLPGLPSPPGSSTLSPSSASASISPSSFTLSPAPSPSFARQSRSTSSAPLLPALPVPALPPHELGLNPKRFSIRRAKSFDRPVSRVDGYEAYHAPHHPHHLPHLPHAHQAHPPGAAQTPAQAPSSSVLPSSSPPPPTPTPSTPTSQAPAPANSSPANPAPPTQKVHFAPPPRPRPRPRLRRPRTATLPVPAHLTRAALELELDQSVDLDLGAGRPGPGSVYSPALPALSALPALPALQSLPGAGVEGSGGRETSPLDLDLAAGPGGGGLGGLGGEWSGDGGSLREGRRPFWRRRRRSSASRPSSRGKDDAATSPSPAGSPSPFPPPPLSAVSVSVSVSGSVSVPSTISVPGASASPLSPLSGPSSAALSPGSALGPSPLSSAGGSGSSSSLTPEIGGRGTPTPPPPGTAQSATPTSTTGTTSAAGVGVGAGGGGGGVGGGGGGGGGGLWERATRRRASSAFLRSLTGGGSGKSPAEAVGAEQSGAVGADGPKLRRSGSATGSGLLNGGSLGGLGGLGAAGVAGEEKGRRRASTLLSPVQIFPEGGRMERLEEGVRLEQTRSLADSPVSAAAVTDSDSPAPTPASKRDGSNAARDSPREIEREAFPSPSPSPTTTTSSRPSTATPVLHSFPPRSRSTTLDSLASLATSFPWARNSLLLSGSGGILLPHTAAGSDPPTPAASSPTSHVHPHAHTHTPPPGGRPSLSRLGLLGMSGKKSGSVPAGLGQVLRSSDDEQTREESDVSAAVAQADGSGRGRERRRKTHEEVEREVELERVVRTVSRAELAGVLCGTPLLALYFSRLTPSPFPPPQLYAPGLPLDISLRVLLMHLALPKETQAIDRFVETFATTWAERYPGLVTPDQAYILAFSMIMLHTDHFNPSNKRKMSREDYVRNTRRDGGVPDVVLEYFYDNITFTRFIFVEDAVDVNGQRSFMPAPDISPSGISVSPAVSASGSGGRSKGKKIDVYYLIAQGRLDPLRAPVAAWIPPFDPFSYAGSHGGGAEEWVERCNEAFANAAEVRVDSIAGRSTSGLASLGNFGTGSAANGGTTSMTEAQDGGMILKLTKVAALLRRQESTESGKKSSSSKWRNLGVAITGSQLLFFKDPTWILVLKENAEAARRSGGQAPRLASFRPDEWVSLRDAVALYDTTYLEHEYTFRLVLPHQKHYYLFQVSSEEEMNEWMALINYAASFKTAGVRMRSAGMTSRQLGLAALAAAESHVREVRSASGGSSPAHLSRVVSLDDSPPTTSPALTPVESGTDSTAVSTSPSLPSLPDPADQLEATFREIKAELAAVRPGMADLGLGVPPLAAGKRSPAVRTQSLFVGTQTDHPPEMVRSNSLGPLLYSSVNSSGEFSIRKGWLASRSEVIDRKIVSFEQEIAKLEPYLETDLRASRNLAMLTPFQKSTREKINAAVQPLARRVTQLRINLARLKCYCDVLRSDLDAEQREWVETKQTAFELAEARLGGRPRGLRVEVPRMTLSMHLESPREVDRDSADGHRYTPVAGRPASTRTSESFPSATDTPEPIWSGEHSPGFQTPISLFRSRSTLAGSIKSSGIPEELPTPTNGRSSLEVPSSPRTPLSQSTPSPGEEAPPLMPSVPSDGPAVTPEEETAEDWGATRAARRVSLVRIPSSGLKPRRSVHSKTSSGSSGA